MDKQNTAKELLMGNECEISRLSIELRAAEAKNKQMEVSLTKERELREANERFEKEVAGRRQVEEELCKALAESGRQREEITALLKSSRAVLEHNFKDAARVIFQACRELLGATTGYISLKNNQGEYKAVYLEPGDRPCTVDPLLPVPIRGMRQQAYDTGRVVYCNNFADSQWVQLLPKGHIALKNVMYAPLVIRGEVLGLLVFGNKPVGFNEDDVRMVTAFSKDAAVALHNSRLLESLKHSEEHFRSVAESAVDAIITIDIAGKIIFWNNSAESIFGYSREEAVGSNITIIIPERLRHVHQEGVYKMVPWCAYKGGRPLESYALRRDGKEFPVEVSTSRWVSQGNVYFTGIIRDMSSRIRLQGEMARLDRLDLVGQLAAGIGHEIRNPMTAVRGFLQLLAAKDECAKFKDFFDLMVGELDRANTIITEFLSMARNKQAEMKRKNINTVVMALQPLILADAMHGNKNVSVQLEEVPDILLDEKEIRQLILNLVRNGLDAMPVEGTLTIMTRADGEGVLLIVQDQGCGIQPDVLEKMGTPFFTTKENGTGIGLAVCYGIAVRHNASIDINTGPWGTMFTVRFQRECIEVIG